jgi:RNA polymerase sigma factor (sigma-70 family)
MSKETYRQLAVEFKNTKSEKSFTKLYYKIQPRMNSYILGIVKDPIAAQDIVASAMTKVYTKIDQYNPDYQITTWAYTIAYHDAIQYMRDNGKKVSLSVFQDNGTDVSEDDDYGLSSASSGPSYTFGKTEEELYEREDLISSKFREAIEIIKSLKPIYRDIMVARFVDGLSYKEIEDECNKQYEEEVISLSEEIASCFVEELRDKLQSKLLNLKKKKPVNGQTVKNRINRGRKLVQSKLGNLDFLGEEI